MLAHHLKTKAVQGADMSRFEQGQLLLPAEFGGGAFELFLEAQPDPLAHFGGGGLGKGDHQDFIEGGGRGLVEQTMQATFDQGMSFAGAGAGNQDDVAGGGDGLELGRSRAQS